MKPAGLFFFFFKATRQAMTIGRSLIGVGLLLAGVPLCFQNSASSPARHRGMCLSAWFRHPDQFAQSPVRVGNEIEYKQRKAALKRRIGKFQMLGVAYLKSDPVWRGVFAPSAADVLS